MKELRGIAKIVDVNLDKLVLCCYIMLIATMVTACSLALSLWAMQKHSLSTGREKHQEPEVTDFDSEFFASYNDEFAESGEVSVNSDIVEEMTADQTNTDHVSISIAVGPVTTAVEDDGGSLECQKFQDSSIPEPVAPRDISNDNVDSTTPVEHVAGDTSFDDLKTPEKVNTNTEETTSTGSGLPVVAEQDKAIEEKDGSEKMNKPVSDLGLLASEISNEMDAYIEGVVRLTDLYVKESEVTGDYETLLRRIREIQRYYVADLIKR